MTTSKPTDNPSTPKTDTNIKGDAGFAPNDGTNVANENVTPADDPNNYIVHRRTWTDNKGVQQQEDTRMTMDEWPAYAKENNL